MKLRAATSDDAAAIARIYAPYVTASAISFETEVPDEAAMRVRIAGGADLHPWLVGLDEGAAVCGYAYATAFRPRLAYRFAVETSVYVAERSQRAGIGTALYRSLLAILEAQGFVQAVAAIALPNPPSVRLHEKLGFVAIGAYPGIGYKLGRWHDVGLWQRPLAGPADPPLEPLPLGCLPQPR